MAERTNPANDVPAAGDSPGGDLGGSDPAHNEFALIDRILERLGDAVASDILLPPGDDAAALAADVIPVQAHVIFFAG